MNGMCACGCGQPAPIAKTTDPRRGWIKGQPVRFIRGHQFLRHGHARHGKRSPEYFSWSSMVSRCTDPKRDSFNKYGARGISVCERWNPDRDGSFDNFLADMGPRPKGKTLDRIDPDKNYEPANCRWSTSRIQTHNQRKRSNTTSHFRGVSFYKRDKKFVAGITANDKTVYLGSFISEVDAAEAYDDAAKKHYGEFAVLNFPEQTSVPWETAEAAA
jgi:hypothetical protein